MEYECASDQGGPRKEFFRLVLSAVKEKYFDKGLREHLAKDYVTVGKIMALSILQNGPMPSFLNEDIRNDLFSGKDSSSLCIKNLRTGLDVLGVVKVEEEEMFHFSTYSSLLQEHLKSPSLDFATLPP